MDPIALRTQLRHNNKDLEDFCSDLKSWGEEMNRTDQATQHSAERQDTQVPLPRNKVGKQNVTDGADGKSKDDGTKRIRGCDYAAWDRFDVEAECARVEDDEEQDGELTDEYDEGARDDATHEKEKGNEFVKNRKWDQAIACYAKAIEFYAYDPVFYANRALCHLKKENFRGAESDCTVALQLDRTYVKAYQRRACARESLGQYSEARDDLLKVFDYEPNNKESRNVLKRIEGKLGTKPKPQVKLGEECGAEGKSKFASMREQRKKAEGVEHEKMSKFASARKPALTLGNAASQQGEHTLKLSSAKAVLSADAYWPSGADVDAVAAIHKTVQSRSKKPLKRIETINETETVALPRAGAPNSDSIRCDDFVVVQRKQAPPAVAAEETQPPNKPIAGGSGDSAAPTTSTQFHLDWRNLDGDPAARCEYLKRIDPTTFPSLFGDTLEPEVFGGIIRTLARTFVKDSTPVYEYLKGLSGVGRFSILAMFMSGEDRDAFFGLAQAMRRNENVAADDVEALIKVYGV